MTQADIRKAIKRYGKHKSGKGKTAEYSVSCTVCGKELLNTEPEENEMGASITKRGSAIFWHGKCRKNVWNSKIHWEAPK